MYTAQISSVHTNHYVANILTNIYNRSLVSLELSFGKQFCVLKDLLVTNLCKQSK